MSDLREALKRVIAADENNTWSSNRNALVSFARAALSAQPQPDAVEAVIGGTAFCGHGVMASICDKCADEGKESNPVQDAEPATSVRLSRGSDQVGRTGGANPPTGGTPPDATAQREAIAQWPDGCRNPNSCSIHRDCMYLQCKHYDRDISGEVDAALSTRAGG